MRIHLILASLLLALGASPCAAELQIERLPLGPADPALQTYNPQEQRELRVFARSAAGFKRSQIFWQRRVEGQWLAPEPMPFADPRWRDSDPHLSGDGKTLTFVSDRPVQGGQPPGQLDIFESTWADGQWSAARRLSEAVQSPAYELGPERYGDRLYFASYRAGGPGTLAVYQSERLADGQHSAPVALPAPINMGRSNSDFTLSPDGRYALWWSDRAPEAGGGPGDLFLAERVGTDFGPAIRLPAPINSPAFEFTPSVSSDGRWLMFASTRPGEHAAGLSQVYRVSWPALLTELGPQAEAFSQAQLDQRLSALWRSIGSEAGAAPDIETLRQLLHPDARVWGQSVRTSNLAASTWSVTEFLAMLKKPSPQATIECEVHREVRRYGGHAQVYSVVETRRRAGQAQPDYTGVNSSQWQLGPQGWLLLSLHYALELPGQAPPHTRRSGDCMG